MATKLQAVGRELVLVLDESTRRALGVDAETPVEVSVEDGKLLVRRAAGVAREELDRVVDEVTRVHDETLRKLAQ